MTRFVKPGKMVKWRRRDVVIPFPWALGEELPQLGVGEFYVIDDDGAYVTDDDGKYVIGRLEDLNG